MTLFRRHLEPKEKGNRIPREEINLSDDIGIGERKGGGAKKEFAVCRRRRWRRRGEAGWVVAKSSTNGPRYTFNSKSQGVAPHSDWDGVAVLVALVCGCFRGGR